MHVTPSSLVVQRHWCWQDQQASPLATVEDKELVEDEGAYTEQGTPGLSMCY